MQLGHELLTDIVLKSVVGACRVETSGEQRHDQPRSLAVRDERALHVRLAERATGLTQIGVDATKDGHLAPVQARREEQPVESVIPGFSVPDRGERLLQQFLEPPVGQRHGVPLDQLELLDPDGIGSRWPDVERLVVGDPKTHVLQHREHVGEQRRTLRRPEQDEPSAVRNPHCQVRKSGGWLPAPDRAPSSTATSAVAWSVETVSR